MDTDFLFNIKHVLGKSGKLCSVEATDSYNGVLLGTPGVVIPDSLNINNSSKTFFVFPPNVGINAGSALNLVVVYKEDKPVLFDDYKIKEVEAFGFDKLNNIYDSVLERGGLSIVINNCEQAAMFSKSMAVVAKMFNFNSVIQSSNYNPPEAFYNGIEEEVNMAITFLRLDHCIPIFNTKKVEGMGVICTLFPKNYSAQHETLYKIREFSMLLSSFKDNVFVIDGERTMPICPLSDDMEGIYDFKHYSGWKKDGDKFELKENKPKAVKPRPKANKKRVENVSSKYGAAEGEKTIYKEGVESDNMKYIVRNGRWALKEQTIAVPSDGLHNLEMAVEEEPVDPGSLHGLIDTSLETSWSNSTTSSADMTYYVSGSSKTSNNW